MGLRVGEPLGRDPSMVARVLQSRINFVDLRLTEHCTLKNRPKRLALLVALSREPDTLPTLSGIFLEIGVDATLQAMSIYSD